MQVRKLIQWGMLGKGEAEIFINSIVPNGEYRKLDSKIINHILKIKNIHLGF